MYLVLFTTHSHALGLVHHSLPCTWSCSPLTPMHLVLFTTHSHVLGLVHHSLPCTWSCSPLTPMHLVLFTTHSHALGLVHHSLPCTWSCSPLTPMHLVLFTTHSHVLGLGNINMQTYKRPVIALQITDAITSNLIYMIALKCATVNLVTLLDLYIDLLHWLI